MGRILHPGPPGSAPAHRRWVWACVGVAILAGVAAWSVFTQDAPAIAVAPRTAAPQAAVDVPSVRAAAVPAALPSAVPAVAACPLQALQLALADAAPRTVCMAATVLQQNGGVRSVLVRAGDAEGWTLRIDTSMHTILAVHLQARDGREFDCAPPGCDGQAALVEPRGAGPGAVELRDLRLAPRNPATTAGGARLTARLQVPADEQVPGLACTGPSLGISLGNGATRRFCGQGGAGVEFADDGQRVYRLQDHEGRTLTVVVDADERIASVAWEGRACQGAACRGASTASTNPADPLAERSFHFGRTALFHPRAAAGATAWPAVVLEGAVVVPAQ